MNIILADNQYITRAGICLTLSEIEAQGERIVAKNKRELIDHLQKSRDAVVVLDVTNMDFDGSEDLLIVQKRFPEAEWILFSLELSETFIRNTVLGSDRMSIVMKDADEDEMRFALKSVLHHERYICHSISNLLLNAPRNSAENSVNLTPSEREILKSIAMGKTTKEIANERFLSFHTVNTHRKNIFRKLNVNNVHEATKYALRAGIIDMAEYCI